MGHLAGFKYHQGSAAGGVGYEPDQSPTLTADYHQPAVMSLQGDGSSSNGNQNGCGYSDDGSAYTLNSRDKQAIAFAQNTRDEVRLFGGDGQTVGALAAQPGMKQTSYVVSHERDKQSVCIQGSMLGREDANGPNGAGYNENLSFTLNTIDRHAVAFTQNQRGEVRLEGL